MNIDIDEMSDQEKSVMLARLCKIDGLSVRHVPKYISTATEPDLNEHEAYDVVVFRNNGESRYGINLYDPANMALAWRVLNWATNEELPICNATHRFYLFSDMDIKPPADAQQAWLDKILALAIKAGMVTE